MVPTCDTIGCHYGKLASCPGNSLRGKIYVSNGAIAFVPERNAAPPPTPILNTHVLTNMLKVDSLLKKWSEKCHKGLTRIWVYS